MKKKTTITTVSKNLVETALDLATYSGILTPQQGLAKVFTTTSSYTFKFEESRWKFTQNNTHYTLTNEATNEVVILVAK